jgi:hypothetical protein
MKLANHLKFRVISFGLCGIAIVSASANAQTRPRTGTTNDADRIRAESEADLDRRIWNLRALSEMPRQPERKKPDVKQALAEMQKDFTRLQLLNRELLTVALKGTLEPKFVWKAVAEIKERAERLNKNLALPEADTGTEKSRAVLTPGPDHLKRSIIRLGTLIYSFVDNPFFKEINVVDAQEAAKARRDLADIITLSAEIKKDNEPKN